MSEVRECKTCRKFIKDDKGLAFLEEIGECPECSLKRDEDRDNFNEMQSD